MLGLVWNFGSSCGSVVLARGIESGLRNGMGSPKVIVWNRKGFGTLVVGVCQLLVLNAAQSHVKVLQSVGDVAQYGSLMEVVWQALIHWVAG